MRNICGFVAGVLLATGQAHAASGEVDDWHLFGRLLSLVQSVVHDAAQSNDPRAVEKRVEGLLSGENAEANRLARDIVSDAFGDVPPQYKSTVLALARDFAALARKERERQSYAGPRGAEATLQARRDLAAIGLRYFDSRQLLDAVRRDDALAVELFVAARGVDLGARDADGLTALEIAQRRNNRRLVDLLASATR